MDYQIINSFYDLNSSNRKILKFHIKCSICGHEKDVLKSNFEKGLFNHNRANCKEDYLDSWIGKQIDDYVVLSRQDDIYKIQCTKCKISTNVCLQTLQNSKTHSHLHGNFCLKLIPQSEIKRTIVSRFYNMQQRCNNVNNTNYQHYGERQIKLKYAHAVDLYLDFYKAFEDIVLQGGDISKYSFDRIDVNGDYEKDNLRLTTQNVQSTNTTRKKIFILFKDEQKVICDNAMEFGRFYNINGRSVGNVVRRKSKTASGWRLVRILKPEEDIDEVIKNEGVTTKLITTL